MIKNFCEIRNENCFDTMKNMGELSSKQCEYARNRIQEKDIFNL